MDDQLMLPAPEDRETPIQGYPEGFWLNYVTFSRDSQHVAFAVRSPGDALRWLPHACDEAVWHP